jgi:hypothetical protein
MAYKSTRRQWVKLWVNEWLDGTSRFELTAQQRLLWIDLLALAGRSRFPGYIYAGEAGDGSKVGYPIAYLAGVLQMDEVTLNNALKLLQLHAHITLDEVTPDVFVIGIINWEKYQSEYLRQKTYRKVTTKTTSRLPVEGEVEGEVDVEAEAEEIAAFAAIQCEPFGSKRFRAYWKDEFQNKPNNLGWADSMERVIAHCKATKVAVPGRFFAHKREIEKIEATQAYKRTPL